MHHVLETQVSKNPNLDNQSVTELQKTESTYNKCLPRSTISKAPLAKRTSNNQKKDFIHIITCYPNHLAS